MNYFYNVTNIKFSRQKLILQLSYYSPNGQQMEVKCTITLEMLELDLAIRVKNNLNRNKSLCIFTLIKQLEL